MTDETDISGENVENPEKGIKAHLRRHKTGYLIAGSVAATAVVTVAVTVVVTKRLSATETIAPTTIVKQLNYKSTPVTVVQVGLERRGHPGFVVKCNETGEVFASINRAATANGINAGNLSAHLAGLRDSVDGKTFTKLGEAGTPVA